MNELETQDDVEQESNSDPILCMECHYLVSYNPCRVDLARCHYSDSKNCIDGSFSGDVQFCMKCRKDESLCGSQAKWFHKREPEAIPGAWVDMVIWVIIVLLPLIGFFGMVYKISLG